MKLSNQDKTLLIMAVSTGLLAIGGLALLVSAMSDTAVRAWGVVSVVVIPLAFFAGWRLGTRDSRAHLSGLDKGVDMATRAMTRTGRARRAVTMIPASPTLRLLRFAIEDGEKIVYVSSPVLGRDVLSVKDKPSNRAAPTPTRQ
jgi:hypothetical protein